MYMYTHTYVATFRRFPYPIFSPRFISCLSLTYARSPLAFSFSFVLTRRSSYRNAGKVWSASSARIVLLHGNIFQISKELCAVYISSRPRSSQTISLATFQTRPRKLPTPKVVFFYRQLIPPGTVPPLSSLHPRYRRRFADI